jgi:hypothetical protein
MVLPLFFDPISQLGVFLSFKRHYSARGFCDNRQKYLEQCWYGRRPIPEPKLPIPDPE